MAEQIAPTRSNLLQRRDQLQLANRGADLLKRKRDALIAEFFDLVQSSLEARRSLSGTSQEAYFSLFLANAWDGPEAVESLSLAAQSGLDVDIKMENLFGVKVPEVQPPSFSDDLPFSPINAGARTLDAAREFRKLTEALIKVAATETRLRRIGEEIKKTNRRVNALEQLVIPGINQQIKDIRSVLDQRALEEVTVLKRIKAKLEAREEEEKKEAEQDAKAESQTSEPYPDNETSMAETVEDIESVGVVSESAQSSDDASDVKEGDSAKAEADSAKARASSSVTSAAAGAGGVSSAEASSAEASSAETSSPQPSKADSQAKMPETQTSDETKDKAASATATQPSDTSKADAPSKAASSTAKSSEAKAPEPSSQTARDSATEKSTPAKSSQPASASASKYDSAQSSPTPQTSAKAAQGDVTKEGDTAKSSTTKSSQPAKPSASSQGAAAEAASSGSDGLLLGNDPKKYVANLEKYTSDVNGNVVRAILESFGEAVNDRDAMTVACSQPKELRYIKRNLLRGRLNLESSDEVLDNALQEVCEQMGRSNRNKSSVTYYYLITERFGKLPVWLA